MQFFAWGINRPGMKEARAAIIHDHWDFIDRYADRLILRGPALDPADLSVVTGSIHIIDLEDEAAFRRFVDDEPFAAAGLFAEIHRRRFRLELGRTQFQFESTPDCPRFFIHCPARQGAGEQQAALADAHDSYCRSFDRHMICRGALLDDNGAWDGALFFVEFPSQDDAAGFLAGEPYNAAGLFAETSILRWTMGGRENLSAIGALK